MTDDTNTTMTDEQSGDSGFGPGALVNDTDEGATLVVIADTGKEATEHHVASAGESVAELNPDYPEDDTVLFCAYRNALDEQWGTRWRDWTPTYLAFAAGNEGAPVYSFPESRLEAKPEDPEADDE